MKLLFLSLLLLSTAVQAEKLSENEKKKALGVMAQYKGPKTLLLSYPRSGNTWMRYCLEYNTQRPTFHRQNYDPRNQPLGWLAGFEVDCTKPPIEKTHVLKVHDKNVDQLILLVRNPKEAIKRASKIHDLTEHFIKKEALYFENIAIYDSWHPEKRLLIYYEDFITNPAETLQKVLAFLNEPPIRLAEFLDNYEFHQKKAMEIYRESHTKAKDLLYHSRQVKPEVRKQADILMEQFYPLQWNIYLKHRFSEDVLDYALDSAKL